MCWMRETTPRREAKGSSLTHPIQRREVVLRIQHEGPVIFTTSRNKPCLLVSLYLMNILRHKSLLAIILAIISWRFSPVKFVQNVHLLTPSDQHFRLGDLNRLSTKYIDVHYVRFRTIGQITVMGVSLNWPIIFLGYLINIYEAW